MKGARLTRGLEVGESLMAGPHLSASGAKRKREGERLGRRRGELGRGERGLGVFFLNSFQIHFSNFQTPVKQETMHSNHVA
jgi:hypothetical protein